VHHIVLENLTIIGHGPEQQTVGISTQAPAAFWTIRNNIIVGAGTGLYLGGSDGSAPFVAGLIEANVVVDTTGYNLQIKHQRTRPTGIGLPDGANRTIIRGNVFSKSANSSAGPMARPNVLLGHLPVSGAGNEDEYRVEGNVFHGNPTEALLQAEGNLAIEGNLFINPTGEGVTIQPHNDLPRRVSVRNNLVWARGFGLRIIGADPRFPQILDGNDVHTSVVDAPNAEEKARTSLAEWLQRTRETSAEKYEPLKFALTRACQMLPLRDSRYASVRVAIPSSAPCLALTGVR